MPHLAYFRSFSVTRTVLHSELRKFLRGRVGSAIVEGVCSYQRVTPVDARTLVSEGCRKYDRYPGLSSPVALQEDLIIGVKTALLRVAKANVGSGDISYTGLVRKLDRKPDG